MDTAGLAFVFIVTEYFHVKLSLLLGEEGHRAHEARVAVAVVTSAGFMVLEGFPVGKRLGTSTALKIHGGKDKTEWARTRRRRSRKVSIPRSLYFGVAEGSRNSRVGVECSPTFLNNSVSSTIQSGFNDLYPSYLRHYIL